MFYLPYPVRLGMSESAGVGVILAALGVREHDPGESYPVDMADLPKPLYSKREVVSAGKVLRQKLIEGQPFDDYGLAMPDAFRIAHNWRDAHMYPLLRVRQELGGKVRSIEQGAFTSARLKRMNAIRRKLKRPFTLYQMQDIAGCRAVLRSMEEVSRLVDVYRSGGSRHRIADEDDYIARPKDDGYRSHHLILKYCGAEDDAVYNRQTVEVQIRTRLQHSWATAVEAVGLIRKENLKGGAGSADWLRFFQLMSAHFAELERCPIASNTPATAKERKAEIIALAAKLDAYATLDDYKLAIKGTERWQVQSFDRYFLLQFDYESRTVHVEPFMDYALGSERYIEEEAEHATTKNTVLVEVDKVADLKKAFPNYFLDVTAFNERLSELLWGDPIAQGESASRGVPPKRATIPHDWAVTLRNWKFWKAKGRHH
jgi:hypothetical protein